MLALAPVDNQPPAPTSSAVKRASYQDNSDYSEKSEKSPNGSGSGNSGRQYLGLGASGVAGSGPVSTGTSSTGNTTSGGIISNGKITLPTGCENANGIGFGWLPNDNSASLAADDSAVGKKTSLLRWILWLRVPFCRTLHPSLDDFLVSRISLTIMTLLPLPCQTYVFDVKASCS